MRRLVLVLALAFAPSAHAAAPEPASAVDVARDGTTVVARMNYGATPSRPALSVRLDGGKPVLLDRGREQRIFGGPVVAAGPGGRAIVAWPVLVARRGEASFDTNLKVVFAKRGGGFTAPQEFGDGDSVSLDMNDAGDAAMSWVADGDGYHAYTAFAPATARSFGDPVPVPAGESIYDEIAMTSTGETVMLAFTAARTLDAVTRRADGPLDVTTIAEQISFGSRIAADDRGRALAVWSSSDGSQALRTSVRAPDGTWSAPARSVDLAGSEFGPPIVPGVSVAPDGSAVLMATSLTGPGPVSAVNVVATTGDLATGTFAPPVTLGTAGLGTNGAFPSLAAHAGNGGDALAAYADPATRTLFTVRAAGGAFAAPVRAACGSYVSDVFTRDGETLLRADSALLQAAERRSPCPPAGGPTVVVPRRPVAGRPARLILAATGSRVREVRFKFASGEIQRGRVVRHTFRRRGRVRYEVSAVVDGSLVRLRRTVRVA